MLPGESEQTDESPTWDLASLRHADELRGERSSPMSFRTTIPNQVLRLYSPQAASSRSTSAASGNPKHDEAAPESEELAALKVPFFVFVTYRRRRARHCWHSPEQGDGGIMFDGPWLEIRGHSIRKYRFGA
ncbi:MAG: hypothetical protein R2706_16210 [Acidimicrobiales bacterium]